MAIFPKCDQPLVCMVSRAVRASHIASFDNYHNFGGVKEGTIDISYYYTSVVGYQKSDANDSDGREGINYGNDCGYDGFTHCDIDDDGGGVDHYCSMECHIAIFCREVGNDQRFVVEYWVLHRWIQSSFLAQHDHSHNLSHSDQSLGIYSIKLYRITTIVTTIGNDDHGGNRYHIYCKMINTMVYCTIISY